MNLYSINFIAFTVVLISVYWFICRNKKAQNYLLLTASYIFYGLFDWRFLLLLVFTSLVTYNCGILLTKNKHKKFTLITSLVVILASLFYFKYFNFFIDSLKDLLTAFGVYSSIHPLEIILPVGISFYTFSAISYCVDVYKKKILPTNDIVECFLFLSFFPSILSGPINRADKQLPQYQVKRIFNNDLLIEGFKNFLIGVFMKLCVADRLGLYVDAVYGNISHHNGLTLLIACVLYSIQIYADFGGYSLMAIGVGKAFGIRLETNFNRPYFARSITEFWSRWHMSLTAWLKDYIYIPLGGNRVSKTRWILNILIVFIVSGIWHGAAYSFIVWGAIHGISQVAEKLLLGSKLKPAAAKVAVPIKSTPPYSWVIRDTITRIIQVSYTFALVSIAWIFFRLPTVTETFEVLKKISSDWSSPFVDLETLLYATMSMMILFVYDYLKEKNSKVMNILNKPLLCFICFLCLLFYIILCGQFVGGSFIYFQF